MEQTHLNRPPDPAAFPEERSSVKPALGPMTKYFFLHIPKTAGSALTALLESRFTPDEIAPYTGPMDAIEQAGQRLICGHRDFDDASRLSGDVRIITYLRDPLDRVLSLYNFWRSYTWEEIARRNMRGNMIAKSHSFLEFIRHPQMRSHMNNGMYRMLIGREATILDSTGLISTRTDEAVEQTLERLPSFFHVGFQESYTDSTVELFEKMGSPVQNEELQRTPSSRDESERGKNPPILRTDLSPEAVDSFADLNAIDIAIHQQASAMLSQAPVAA